MADVTVGGVKYTYSEASFGKNRGIHISAPGMAQVRLQLRPNPHDDRDYNKNPARFYLDLATAIGTWANANGAMPPDGTVFDVFNVDYTIERR